MAEPSESLGVEPNQIIGGKYRLDRMLGRGGMGAVWRAEHLELGSPVAIKLLRPDVGTSANSRARFLREARAAAMLRSPHVVQILEHGTDGPLAFIAMELMEGETLQQRLQRERPLSPELTATILTHVGRAMARAHEMGIVHRDLKPDNVFLVANDDEVIAKVLDFGIAKSSVMQLANTGESPYTQTGSLLGTPYYMSPEQATGEKSVDHRADLWAMGVIAYECLVGKRPYQSDSLGDLVLQICSKPQPVPSQVAPVPPGFDAWFEKAQRRDPQDRFQSAKAMTRALRQVLLGDAPGRLEALPSSDRSSIAEAATLPTRPPPPSHPTEGPVDGMLAEPTRDRGASGAETLDAMTGTVFSTRPPWLLGALGAALVLALAALGGWRLARSDAPETVEGSASSVGSGSVQAVTPDARSAAAPAPELAASDVPAPSAEPDAIEADAALPAPVPAPVPRSRPAPRRAPRPAPRPAPPPPLDDPLGI